MMIITISATSGSSGFGSAIRSCIDVSTVEMFHAGFHAPCEIVNYFLLLNNNYGILYWPFAIHVHVYGVKGK